MTKLVVIYQIAYPNMSSLMKYLEQYTALDSNEQNMQARLQKFVAEHADCFERTLSIGHITASSWIVDPSRNMALMLHHKKLDQWFQPGGHCDGDTNVVAVARKEAEEETGLLELTLVSDHIFDIDIHAIPANARDAAHDHYDIRFLFEANPDTPLLINEESQALKWIPLEAVASYNDSESISRLVRKTIALQSLLLVAASSSVP